MLAVQVLDQCAPPTCDLGYMPPFKVGRLRSGAIAAGELRITQPGQTLGVVTAQPAIVVQLHLAGQPEGRTWDGDRAALPAVRAGEAVIYDLRQALRQRIERPLHAVHAYISLAAVEAVAQDIGASWSGQVDCRSGEPVDDPVIRNICAAMLPVVSGPAGGESLLFDQLGLALATHIAEAYGGLQRAPQLARCGLAAWQVRRAKALLGGDLSTKVSLETLARECRLSTSHFCRAFRKSFGASPHAWLTHRRIEAAQSMLSDGRRALVEVALACGFADQPHFTRVFTRSVGASPGAWRRARCEPCADRTFG